MKKLKCLLALLCISILGYGAENFFIVDKDYSPFMGGDALLSVHTGLLRAEDALLDGPQEKKRLAARRFGRFLELLVFWDPLNSTMSVVQHEIFGHGYRIRSLGKEVAAVQKYKIKPPFPYGFGGGATFFDFENSGTVSDLLAITIGGIEGENVLADQIRMRLLQTNQFDGRLASLYTQSEQSLFWYSVITSLSNLKNESIDEPSGNDIESYIYWMNKLYLEHPISVGNVQWRSALNLLDPYTWYGYYAWVMYIVNGKAITPPMIPIGSVKYLPGIRVTMAPYGFEYYLLNSLSYSGKGATFYLRGGKHATGYGGAGFRIPNLYAFGPYELGIIGDVWFQPAFQQSNSAEGVYDGIEPGPLPGINNHFFGGQLSFSLNYALTQSKVANLYLEGGVKSKGYLQGYPISGSPILRGGFLFNY